MKKENDGLDEYIRVSKPGTLVVIGALVLVVAAVLIWGLFGKLPVTETVTGVVINPSKMEEAGYAEKEYSTDAAGDGIAIYCFVDASRFNGEAVRHFTDKVRLQMPDQSIFTGEIVYHHLVPVSMMEAQKILFGNEWVTQQCVSQDYNWWLVIKPDQELTQYEFMLSQVTIITEEVLPIRFLTQ